jgi:hypothetical protein
VGVVAHMDHQVVLFDSLKLIKIQLNNNSISGETGDPGRIFVDI